MGDAGIVRNRAKIASSVTSARAWLAIQEQQGFSNYLWDFFDGKPIQNNLRKMGDMQTQSPLSVTISKGLKQRGFNFCGPTIIYAFAQAVGMFNDHLVGCHCHAKCLNLAKRKNH
jgi:DNA-3-methyladenine glycosylase I